MDFRGMKRQALQSLCKKHGIPANLTNREMANRLALLLKENEKPVDNDQPPCSNNLGEIHCEIESNFKIVNQKVSKKVRFSPENETFIFVSSDTESVSDHDYNPKRRLRKRKSVSNLESKKQVQLSKNVKKAEVSAKTLDNSGRVTRSRVQGVVAGDAEMVFSPLAGNKRGRRRVKNVGAYDKPPPTPDLGDKDDPREDAKSRGGLIRPRLRSKEVVNEALEKAGDGDLAVLRKNSRLRCSKNIRNVKASDGVVLLDQIHEDNAIAVEEAKPEQILKRSKRIMAKNKGSSSLSKDLGGTGIGRRVTRSRKVDEKDSALESEAGSLVVEEESQKVLQLEEPAKSSRRKYVAPQNGKVKSESLACKRTERGQPVTWSRKRSRKIDSEGVSEVEPIVGIVTKDEDLLPNGPPRRSRHSIASLNSVATAVGELRTQNNDGKKKPQRESPLESDVNITKPPRRSSRHASKDVGAIADGVRKDLQTKQSKEQILKEQSSVTVHEPVTKKPLRRSRPNVSKSNVPELADPKGRSAEKNKPSKARMELIEEEGSFRKSSLSHEEQPVMDIVPECGGSKNDSDLCHRKKVRERSNKKRKEGKSVEHSQLGSSEISALNSDEKEFTYNTLNSVDQVSESMELEGASIFQQMQDSTAEVVDNEKENIVDEARMEFLSLDNKLEGAMEYQSCRSFNTSTESGDENLVEQVSTEPVEYLSKINNVVSCGIISPASGFSPAYQEDPNGLKTEESSMGKHVSTVSDKVDDLLADNGKANAQKDKSILELDAKGNYEPDQEETIQENHLSELSGSRDSERSSEKFSNEAEKIYVLVPYDRNEAEEAVKENHLSELSGGRESERSSEKFSNEAEKICVLVPYERHGIAQVDEYATETADIGVEKVADIQLGIIASDDTAAAPCEPAPQSQDGNQLEAPTAMHPEIVGRSAAYHVERESCSNNLIEVPDETIFSEDISFSKLRGQVCTNERTEEIGTMKEKESSEYRDGRTPNEILATVSQVGEFNFGSSEKWGEVLPERSESCLSCGGKTANIEENVGKAVDDPKPQVISFDAKTNDNVDGVKEDDVNDHLVQKELQTMYPFTFMHEVGTKEEAAEINSCSPAAVEETEAETIEKCGLEGMSKNGEDKEEHVVTNKVTEMEEGENGAPLLPLYSMGYDTAFSKYEIELSKTNDLAQGASDVTMSSEYEDGLASVDGMEAQCIGKFGPEEMSKNGEDKEELVMTDKMEEAENGTPMLPLDSMVDDTAFSNYETELSETNGLALGASDVTMSSEYEDGGTPNKIVVTVSQVCEFNFGSSEKQGEVLPDLYKSASIYSESCLSCDGITANKEENVGKAVVDRKAQVISSDAETKANVDGVTEDDVTDHLVEKKLLEQNDNGPDLTLHNAHESCVYATDERDDILDRRTGIESVEDGTKLDKQLFSPFRLNNGCLSDEKKSAVVKSFSVTPSGRNVPGSNTATFSVQNFSLSCGKEYEFHAHSNRVRNYAEGIEMANEDKGFGHEKVNPPVQGENELGIDKRVEDQNNNEGTNDSTDGFAVGNNARTSPLVVAEKLDGYTDILKLASQMDSDDDLDLNNLFNSNSTNSKRNSKETGEEIDLHDLDSVAISSGQSNEFSDCGNNASILKREMNFERSAVSPATASTTENKALEIAAEMALFTSYELNLFSEDRERDEFEEADVRPLKDKLINKNNEAVNEGREIVSSIENFEKEQHCDHEQHMVEEVIMLKHTQLVAADKPNLINGTNEVSEGREIVGSIVSNLELNEGRENVESIGKDCDDEHGMVEEFEIGKQNQQLSASDEYIYENGSIPKEKGGVPVIKQRLVDCKIHKFESIEFENFPEATQIKASNYAASDTSRAECCASDSKKPEIHVNSAVEAVASKNPQKLESREDKSPEAKLMERISRSAMPKMRTNKDFSIPSSKNIHKIYDMKENFPSSKREQVHSMTATKTSVKRRALEDLQKN